jgi:hypothetical protein
MRKIAKRPDKDSQELSVVCSMQFLVRYSTRVCFRGQMVLLVMLQFVDPDVLIDQAHVLLRSTSWPIWPIAFDYSTHENQLIPVKQLLKHSANVNVSIPDGATPLAQGMSLRQRD